MAAFGTTGTNGLGLRTGAEVRSLARKTRSDLNADPGASGAIRGIVDQLMASELHVGYGNALAIVDTSGVSVATFNSDGAHSIGKAGATVTFPGSVTVTGTLNATTGAQDAWDVAWTSAAGNPGTSGNYTGSPTASIFGVGAFDAAAADFNGVSAWKFTPTSASARQGLQLTLSQTMNTSCEIRVRFYGPAQPFVVGFGMDNAVDAQLLVSPGTSSLTHTPGTNTAIGATADITNKWLTMTLRVTSVSATATSRASLVTQIWLGELYIGAVAGNSMPNGVSVDNAIRIERNSGAVTTPFYIAGIWFRTGLNERLPSQTFLGKGFDQ